MQLTIILQMLQPIEADWEELASFLGMEHVVKSIKADCLHKDAHEKALFEAIKMWLSRTEREHRKWSTLYTIAEKWGDNTLSQFLKNHDLSGKYILITLT